VTDSSEKPLQSRWGLHGTTVRLGSVKKWVWLGAWTRLAEMDFERAEIFKAFPDFRRRAPTDTASRLRPKRRISAKARTAMQEGIRRYLAKRKAAEKK
jgi:hypothetical protein